MSVQGLRASAWALALSLLAGASGASEVGCPARLVEPATQAAETLSVSGNACSLPVVPGEFYAAVSGKWFAGSAICGRCARVTAPAGSATVRIVDQASGIDFMLDQAAWDALGGPEAGYLPISWETVACEGDDPMKLEFEGSHTFYLKVQVQDHRHGIGSVELGQGNDWLAMERSADNHFVRTAMGAPFTEPVSFRITDLHGQVVETDGVSIVNGTPLDAGVQLVPCPEPGAGAAALAVLAALTTRARAGRSGHRRSGGAKRGLGAGPSRTGGGNQPPRGRMVPAGEAA